MMKLRIDTSGMEFMAAGPLKRRVVLIAILIGSLMLEMQFVIERRVRENDLGVRG